MVSVPQSNSISARYCFMIIGFCHYGDFRSSVYGSLSTDHRTTSADAAYTWRLRGALRSDCAGGVHKHESRSRAPWPLQRHGERKVFALLLSATSSAFDNLLSWSTLQVLYILSNTNLGLPPMSPIGWVRKDDFAMLPVPSEICFSIEGGNHWPLKFLREPEGRVSSVVLEGLGIWPGVLTKTSDF
eukprot:SAG31_NODE_12868_length_910_cov_1.568434_2_plen_186_part_00